MRIVDNAWDRVQLRPWNGVGRPLRQRRKGGDALFDRDRERVHLDDGPVVDALPLIYFRFGKYGLSTASRSCRIQREAGPSS